MTSATNSKTQKEQVKEFFSANAKSYAAGYHKPTPDLARLLQLLSPQPSWRAVDVGAGTGRITAAIAPLVAEVTAVDLTPAMEVEFRATMHTKGLQNVCFLVGDAEALPLSTACADLVTCARAAHHFPSIEKAVGEMARVLRAGGVVGFIDMTTPEDSAAADLLNAIEHLRDTSHVSAQSPATWRRIFMEQGFRVNSCETQVEKLSLSEWLSPVPDDSEAARQIIKLVESATPSIRQQVFPVWGPEPMLLKQRVIITASVPCG